MSEYQSASFGIDTNIGKVSEDDLASIIYTSGTTGKSKGVMLTHKNIVWDAAQGEIIYPINSNDRFLSLLPLSHVYEFTLGFIFPVMHGASVHYLRKPPTATVLLPVFQAVKPTVMLTVPLIIEKIYRKQIAPKINSVALVQKLKQFPFVRGWINRAAGKKLKINFGGALLFFGIGGAKLDPVVEKFLKEARFPYSIGYGLTETSSLVASTRTNATRINTIGPPIPGNEIRICTPDRRTGQGEIWIKGPNVMRGYYKEPEMTSEVLTRDGWLRTGDLGRLDENGYLVFEGRLKNIIVGATGENIYPEDIEAVINNFEHVFESLVVLRKGKLVALVRLNLEEVENQSQVLRDQGDLFCARIAVLLDDLKRHVNSNVNKFSQVQLILLQAEPFEKTPTQKIKRFLYS